ncbi:unnamed protein product [Blepharisma stoltei]|uniref:Uncharacterized protein n=1 Tax=Blepharisma stoltei TaxID=1481888 RepID=A0AAU9II72_9CILI|nr:unnamed protein product [Blepharisma stoltei]
MSSEEDLNSFLKSNRSLPETDKILHELFKQAFITNCSLDDASCTPEELKTLEELDTLEILENLKDLLTDLLKFKKDYKTSDKAELAKRSEQFEAMLQKLEAEVRNHIRIEHQLKLHIETSQGKVDELEKLKETANKQIRDLEIRLQEKPAENEKIRPSLHRDADRVRKDYEEKLIKLVDAGEKREKIIHKLEHECAKLKNLFEEKSKDCERYKEELNKYKENTISKEKRLEGRGGNNIDDLKRKVEEKAIELNWMQQKIKGSAKSPSLQGKERRSARKSLGEMELIKNSSPYGIRREYTEPAPKKDERPGTSFKKPRSSSRGHIRSHSEHERPASSKRIPLH